MPVGRAYGGDRTRTRRWSRKFGEEAGSSILISLLIPFGAYLPAERLRGLLWWLVDRINAHVRPPIRLD